MQFWQVLKNWGTVFTGVAHGDRSPGDAIGST
jgi:hypothetical protein